MSFFSRKNKTKPAVTPSKASLKRKRKLKQKIFVITTILITLLVIYFWIIPHVQKSITNNQTSEISADSTQVKTADTTRNLNNQMNTKELSANQPEKPADKIVDTTSAATAKEVTSDSSKQLKAKKMPNKKALPIKTETQTKKKAAPKKEAADNEFIKKAIQTSNFLSKEKKAKLLNHYGLK